MAAMAIEERVDHGSGSLRVSVMDTRHVFLKHETHRDSSGGCGLGAL